MSSIEFQEKALKRLNTWYGDSEKTILHTWFDVDIMYAIVKTQFNLSFYRVFQLGDKLEISQDKVIRT